MKRLFLLCALVALAACASTVGMSPGERLALYRQHAAAPVKAFHYFGGLNGWQPLGDAALAVWTRSQQAYLLELAGTCPTLEYASSISISNMMGQVSNFDRVRPLVAGAMPLPCRIKTIRPLDLKSLKDAEQQLRAAQLEAREQEPSTSP